MEKKGDKDNEKILLENTIALQKVMVDISLKLNNLSNQISKLLQLFEDSAKTIAEKGGITGEKRALEKLENISEQNKAIARGIALINEKVSKESPSPQITQKMSRAPSPVQAQSEKEKYQKSPFSTGFE